MHAELVWFASLLMQLSVYTCFLTCASVPVVGKKGLDGPGLGECDVSVSPVALAQDSPTVFNKENCRMMYNQQ